MAVSVIFFIVLFLHFSATQRANQVVLTCGGPEAVSEPGPPGSPGKRGPQGLLGPPGPKGVKGDRESNDALLETVVRLEEKVRILEEKMSSNSDKLESLHYEDCLDAKAKGNNVSGLYLLNSPIRYQGFCDMETDEGGWLVIQKRFDGSTNFFRDWNTYERGFGSLTSEFWLGLQLLETISSSGVYELRIDLKNYDDSTNFAKYRRFLVENSTSFYPLTVEGYSGDAGDAMNYHNGMRFSTFDKDHDKHAGVNCAESHKAGWWFKGCLHANLNGKYSPGSVIRTSDYNRFYGPPVNNGDSRKASEMKIRKIVQ